MTDARTDREHLQAIVAAEDLLRDLHHLENVTTDDKAHVIQRHEDALAAAKQHLDTTKPDDGGAVNQEGRSRCYVEEQGWGDACDFATTTPSPKEAEDWRPISEQWQAEPEQPIHAVDELGDSWLAHFNEDDCTISADRSDPHNPPKLVAWKQLHNPPPQSIQAEAGGPENG